MILSKDNNNNWTPTAGGTGTFIGTAAAFNAIKDTLPVNTVAYITDDGNGDLQPVDAVTNGNMHPVTSNAVYDALNTISVISNGIVSNTSIVTSSSELYAGKIGKIAMIHGNLEGCAIPANQIVTLATLDTSLASAVNWVDVTIDPITTDHSNLRIWVIGNELKALGPSGTVDIRFTCTYFTA